MNARCARCEYGVPVMIGDGHEMMAACTYILRTGRPRPCPPGDECTVFTVRTKETAAGWRAERRSKCGKDC